MMSLFHTIRKLCWSVGVDVARFRVDDHPVARRRKLISSSNIDLVLDVGANLGQFVRYLREDIGYRGMIHSFEPLSAAYGCLEKKAAKDSLWAAHRIALGDSNRTDTIHISRNSYSSSILKAKPELFDLDPSSICEGIEDICVRTLDSFFQESLLGEDRRMYLKIDTQGFEKAVLMGGSQTLKQVELLQLEMALMPLYFGEIPFSAMLEYLGELGFELADLEPGFSDQATGRMLQVDGVFCRKSIVEDSGR